MPFPKQADVVYGRSLLPACLLLLTIACGLPHFSRTALPIHDTAYVAESFHCFYSELLYRGDLARWFPYGNYGVQADLYQLAMHPTQYAVGSVGLASGARDTLLLSQIAMLLNELLFALGMWRLGRELYARPTTAFMVGACAMLSVSWFEQSMFNFCTFYLLPLVLALVVRSIRTGNPTLLLLAGVVELCSLLGNVAYVAPIHFWTLVSCAAPLACGNLRNVKGLFQRRHLANPWLWIMLSVTICIGLFISGAAENLRMLAVGRDATTGKVTLDAFLNYGRPPLIAAIFGFTTGGIPHSDNTYYIGLLPLAMFAYALATERRRAFVGIAGAAFALIWLSGGGWFAKWCYHLPGMSIYRHIGLTFGVCDMLLLLGAGFGFERLLLRLDGRDVSRTPYLWLRLASLAIGVLLIMADFWYARRPDDFTLPDLIPGWQSYLAFRIFIYAAAIGLLFGLRRFRSGCVRQAACNPALIVALAGLVDLGSFRWQVLRTTPAVEQSTVADTIFQAGPLPYRDTRTQVPIDERGRITLEQMGRTVSHHNNAQYGLLCTFAGIDPGRPLYRADIISRGIYEMLVARGGNPTLHPTDEYVPANDLPFQRSIGWGAPKLRLAGQALTAANDEEAIRLFRELPNPDTAVVLATGATSVQGEGSSGGAPASLGTLDVVGFSPNRLRVRAVVDSAQPVWLVYADAWHPGWKATIDGQRAPVLRANLGFKAVELAGGAHEVEFFFSARRRTALAYAIAVIGAASGFGLCGWAFAGVVPVYAVRRYGSRWLRNLRRRRSPPAVALTASRQPQS